MKYIVFYLSIFLTLSACTSFSTSTNSNTVSKGKISFTTTLEDKSIESNATNAIKQASTTLANAHINTYAYNHVLLITGQAPNANDLSLITQSAQKIKKVKRIHNEVTIKANSSIFTRTNDTLLVAKVKARFIGSDNVPAERINVIIEDGTLFLMGLVTQTEAINTTNAAKQVSGLKKIVKIFEYIN